ncbi:MAG: hypothetical protein K9M10_02710 [Candidatus Pacebacteria bacterium]|nr:hypothetical protein [Candidatus Paceibacterota bacterium]MCF7857365.1 hypothetical protein [Candidatus Paceibacterota bacterium]
MSETFRDLFFHIEHRHTANRTPGEWVKEIGMDKQEIIDQISMLLGQLLAESRGNKAAIALITEMMSLIGKIFDSFTSGE